MPPDTAAIDPVLPLIPENDPAPKKRRGPQGTPGRCTNLDYCSIGMQRVLVTIPVGQPFSCPECGGKLRPPAEGMRAQPWITPALHILILLLGISLGAIWGYLTGRTPAAPHQATSLVSPGAAVKLATAPAALGLARLPPDSGSSTPPAQPSATPPALPSYPPVQQRPYPARAVPLETADPAQHLQNEQRFGQVTVDCILIATQGKPICHVGNVRGGDAFSAPSLDWLSSLALHYAPEAHGGVTGQMDHRWRIIFEDYSGAGPAYVPPAGRRR